MRKALRLERNDKFIVDLYDSLIGGNNKKNNMISWLEGNIKEGTFL